MKRNVALEKIKNTSEWEIIVIGGGASGLGTALDAASRGYKTLLLEKGDFAQETSSRSTKLIHGGVRYLQQGRLGFVRESLEERSYLLQNAPHLVHKLPFLLPVYNQMARFFYYGGLKLYDALAGKFSIGKTQLLSMEDTLTKIPTLKKEHLKGSIQYYDAQFDDARLAINLAQTIVEQGGCVINYMSVDSLLKSHDRVVGVVAREMETGKDFEIRGKIIINATGAFVDVIRRMDETHVSDSLIASQGAHIVLGRSFFPSDNALIIPNIMEDRVLFAIPWYNEVLVGTTETLRKDIVSKPKPFDEEIHILLSHIGQYLTKSPNSSDILSSFAGIRPLLKPIGPWKNTSKISRGFQILVSDSKLISITGGKWTTYRKMGETTVNIASQVGNLPKKNSQTTSLHIHGWTNQVSQTEWSFYGADEPLVQELPFSKEKLHPNLPCRPVDVIWAVRKEMARNAEDVLARRNRSQFLNTQASIEITTKVQYLIDQELKH